MNDIVKILGVKILLVLSFSIFVYKYVTIIHKMIKVIVHIMASLVNQGNQVHQYIIILIIEKIVSWVWK